MSVTSELKKIIKDEVSRLGYEFVDLNYGKRGKKWFLQVFCDKKGGLTLEDCTKISRQLGYELDRHPELLSHSYKLEVSSPGLTRPLKTEKDFNRRQGATVKFRLYAPLENYRVWEGKIIEVDSGKVVFEDSEGKKRAVEIENIASAKPEVKI